jgi:hypothetical protein
MALLNINPIVEDDPFLLYYYYTNQKNSRTLSQYILHMHCS